MDERAKQRLAGIQARRALSASRRRDGSAAIVERIARSEAFAKAKTILSYRAVPGEVELWRLEEFKGERRIAYPLCTAPGEMIALCPQGPMDWKKGSFGIWEPIRGRALEIAPEELELLLCPCTAFDADCNRMGMGGGYYDRFLPHCHNALFWAIAFEAQRRPRLAQESWDVPMDGVVTEEKLYTA